MTKKYVYSVSLVKSNFTKEGFQARATYETKPLHPRVIFEARKHNTDRKTTLTDVTHIQTGAVIRDLTNLKAKPPSYRLSEDGNLCSPKMLLTGWWHTACTSSQAHPC